jgi:hypothetical protein
MEIYGNVKDGHGYRRGKEELMIPLRERDQDQQQPAGFQSYSLAVR